MVRFVIRRILNEVERERIHRLEYVRMKIIGNDTVVFCSHEKAEHIRRLGFAITDIKSPVFDCVYGV